jgi:hypothetical protein
VFLAESCQPTDASLSRRFISDELGITDSYAIRGTQQQPQPLLYGIVSKLQEWKHERETDAAYTATDADTNGKSSYVYMLYSKYCSRHAGGGATVVELLSQTLHTVVYYA